MNTVGPKWIVHAGYGHLWRSWQGVAVETWCGATIVGARDVDFREPKLSLGERDCRECLDAKNEGGIE